MNLALKQILDRYSACTLELPDAEKELRQCFGMAENEKLVKAWEHFYATTDIRPRIKKLYEVTLPNDSIEYWLRKPDVNEPKVMAWREVITEYIPTRIQATVGNFELTYDPCDSSKYSATIDGEDIKPHKALTIELRVNEPPKVTIEFKIKKPIKETE